jgi:hypothetical protein
MFVNALLNEISNHRIFSRVSAYKKGREEFNHDEPKVLEYRGHGENRFSCFGPAPLCPLCSLWLKFLMFADLSLMKK